MSVTPPLIAHEPPSRNAMTQARPFQLNTLSTKGMVTILACERKRFIEKEGHAPQGADGDKGQGAGAQKDAEQNLQQG